jgi:hypothetical protein
MGSPSAIAIDKATVYPNEGGPAILRMQVPSNLVEKANDFGGEIRFDPGAGLEELQQNWSSISTEIINVEDQ